MNPKPWTPKQKRFLLLLSSGVSLEEIVRGLKVSPRTLVRWKSLPGFQEALEGACKDLIMEEMPCLLRALTDKAKEGNIQAVKILFDYLGHLRGKSGTDLGEFKEEERQRLREALIKEITSLEGRTRRDGGVG